MKVLITDNVNKTKTKIKLKLLKKVINKLALYQNNKNGGIALILKKVKYNKPMGYLVCFKSNPKSVLNFNIKEFKVWVTGSNCKKKKKKNK